jgi:hypothetical protein
MNATETRFTELEERTELLERAVLKLIANISAAGVLLGGVRRDDEGNDR